MWFARVYKARRRELFATGEKEKKSGAAAAEGQKDSHSHYSVILSIKLPAERRCRDEGKVRKALAGAT